jgi:peptidoglycan/LPS O-acetylase OafA/YrhL
VAGTISYSVFLWHVPVFVIVARDIDMLPIGLQVVLGLGATLVLSTLSYRFVERPLMNRVRRATQPAPVRPVSST